MDRDVSVEEFAQILQQDDDWLAEHYQELTEKYPGQIVAIDKGEIVAVGDEEVELYCSSSRQKRHLVGPLILEVPSPNPNVHGFLL